MVMIKEAIVPLLTTRLSLISINLKCANYHQYINVRMQIPLPQKLNFLSMKSLNFFVKTSLFSQKLLTQEG